MNNPSDAIIIGAGASGVFSAIIAKEADPKLKIIILEKSSRSLVKVLATGGGRCNVTNATYNPSELVRSYPRGSKELIGPFSKFGPKQLMDWFEKHEIPLKIENENRVFPCSDSSKDIVDCLLKAAENLEIDIKYNQDIQSIKYEKDLFQIQTDKGIFYSKKLVLATGSANDGYIYAKVLGHKIEPPIPSLFAFNIQEDVLKGISGASVDPVSIKIKGTKFKEQGSLLITHFGFSGPAVLKLSAIAAKYLHEMNYQVGIAIDWLPESSIENTLEILMRLKNQYPQKTVYSLNPFILPKKLWKAFLISFSEKKLIDWSKKEFLRLAQKLHQDEYFMASKTTNKKEFVTCGGVSLKEIDFKTMESKICKNLYIVGELLDIDALTGGFNLQNAWTTGFIAGSSIAVKK